MKIETELWVERQKEALENDPVGNMEPKDFYDCWDLLDYIQTNVHSAIWQKLLGEWLQTTTGKKWHERATTRIMENLPEND